MADQPLPRVPSTAQLVCECGRTRVVMLRPGPGNQPKVDMPDGWLVWFHEDYVIAECPDHQPPI